MKINKSTGQITWTPIQGQEGIHKIIIEVSDSYVITNQTFNLTVHPHLLVDITNHSEGQKVHGPLILSGNVKGPIGTAVEMNLDNKGWIEIPTNGTWKHNINTKELENGNHTVKFRANWGSYQSNVTSVTFRVNNSEATTIDNIWMVLILLVLITLAIILLIRGLRGQKQSNTVKPKRRCGKTDYSEE